MKCLYCGGEHEEARVLDIPLLACPYCPPERFYKLGASIVHHPEQPPTDEQIRKLMETQQPLGL